MQCHAAVSSKKNRTHHLLLHISAQTPTFWGCNGSSTKNWGLSGDYNLIFCKCNIFRNKTKSHLRLFGTANNWKKPMNTFQLVCMIVCFFLNKLTYVIEQTWLFGFRIFVSNMPNGFDIFSCTFRGAPTSSFSTDTTSLFEQLQWISQSSVKGIVVKN